MRIQITFQSIGWVMRYFADMDPFHGACFWNNYNLNDQLIYGDYKIDYLNYNYESF